MAVLRPLKLVIENYPEGQVEEMEAVNNPEDPSAGTRKVPFSRELCIEQDDFRETPPPKYFRLSPGDEVRLRCAYIVKCTGVMKDPATGRGHRGALHLRPRHARRATAKGRKVKGTIHWVSAPHAVDAEVRLYDTLFTVPKPDEADDFKSVINPQSLEIVRGAKVEPAVAACRPRRRTCSSSAWATSSRTGRTTAPPARSSTAASGLRDTWARIEKTAGA